MKYRFDYEIIGGSLCLTLAWYDDYQDKWVQDKGWIVDSSRKAYEELVDYLAYLCDGYGSIELS